MVAFSSRRLPPSSSSRPRAGSRSLAGRTCSSPFYAGKWRMFVEKLVVQNFKCFGRKRTTINLGPDLTALIGTNGTGKTAACQALLRLFGITGPERAVRREDFHVPVDETEPPTSRQLTIEAVIAFPELDEDDQCVAEDGQDDAVQAPRRRTDHRRVVPEFFGRMAADDDGDLKLRIVLTAMWEDDGTVDGAITDTRIVVSTLAEEYGEEDYVQLPAAERGRIQVVYIPASRDGARELTTFLRSRLWRAAMWSPDLRELVSKNAAGIGSQFSGESVVQAVEGTLGARWTELHGAGTNATPKLRLLDDDFDQLVRETELVFEPDPTGRARPARHLSDGQRSLLHLALTATTLDVEAAIYDQQHQANFTLDAAQLPSLTLVLVEEPENSVSPFYLSRIVNQLLKLSTGTAAQALLSSHCASVLTRIEPKDLRYFRINPNTATSSVRTILLPGDDTEEGKYVREAVQAHPELYFAKFVVLGEGDTEQLVIPRVAQAQGIELDPSFVAVVPLGGRHTNHMWRLLDDLGIPHATLLDLDYGREGAGPARIRDAVRRLGNLGVAALEGLDGDTYVDDIGNGLKLDELEPIIEHLRRHGVFFAAPLDLDYIMLSQFPSAYTLLEAGDHGPRETDALVSVIGKKCIDEAYWNEQSRPELLRWYRYLFLNRSKPSSHLLALSRLTDHQLRASAPEVVTALITYIRKQVGL